MREEERISAVAVTAADLPTTFPPLEPAALALCDRAWYVLELAAFQPERVIAFADLGINVESLAILFGPAWLKLYPGNATGELIPRKVGALLRMSLQRLGSELDKRSEEDRRKAERTAQELLNSPAAKRLRFAAY